MAAVFMHFIIIPIQNDSILGDVVWIACVITLMVMIMAHLLKDKFLCGVNTQ